MRGGTASAAALAALSVLAPRPALAHMAMAGDAVLAGLVHPFHAITYPAFALGLGLWAGAVPGARARMAALLGLGALWAGFVAGALGLGSTAWGVVGGDRVIALALGTLGGVIALDPADDRLAALAILALPVGAGAMGVGFSGDLAPGMAASDFLLGLGAGLGLVAGLGFILRRAAARDWQVMILRVLGSWIACLGLILIAL